MTESDSDACDVLQSEAEGAKILLSRLKEIIDRKSHYYTVHAQEQMAVRRILDVEVRQAISGEKSEIIEEYPEDKYSPSCLIYGVTEKGRVLHVQSNIHGIIVTIYEPDAEKWQEDLKTRRR